MGSSNRIASGFRPERLRQWLGAGRSMLLRLPAPARWALLATALGAVALAGYRGPAAWTAPGETYLASGRRFPSDDLKKVGRALDRQRVAFRVEDRRIAVAADQLEAANAVLAKVEIGARPLDEIRDQSIAPNWIEGQEERRQREQRGDEKILASMIDDLPGIAGSFVRIHRAVARVDLRRVPRVSALVYLDTEEGRHLPSKTIQSITTILSAHDPALGPDAVTVVDRRGERYLDAGNPALRIQSTNRAREEEIRQGILEKLDWIKGVRVFVQLKATGPSPAMPAAAPIPPGPADPEARPAPGPAAREGIGPAEAGRHPASPPRPAPGPAIAINRPLELDPEIPLGADDPAEGAPPAAVAQGPPAPEPSPAPAPAAGRGQVWVLVPRSYYYYNQLGMTPDRREPTYEELQLLVARTAAQIRKAVKLVLPEEGPETWDEPTVDVVPDEVPIGRLASRPAVPEGRRLLLDGGIAGAVGAVAALLVALGAWALGARGPARTDRAPSRFRYHHGSPATPGPTERVREFVRRNPEAAASVIERWTIQEGGPS